VISKLLLGLAVMAGCVVVHASGLTWALRRLRAPRHHGPQFWQLTWISIRVAAWMILCHLIEICLWGVLYVWRGAMPDLQTAFYFSVVTYTTTGYGDLVLPPDWRIVGGIEALTGILMCGASTAFFFAVLARVHALDVEPKAERPDKLAGKVDQSPGV
jgi:Ion channel